MNTPTNRNLKQNTGCRLKAVLRKTPEYKQRICAYRFMHRNAKYFIPMFFVVPFYSELAQAFISYIAEPLLLLPQSSWVLDTWFYTLLLGVIGHVGYKCLMKSVYSLPQLIFSAILLGGYLYYRIVDNPPCYFLRIQSSPALAYFDIIPFYTFSSVVWNLRVIYLRWKPKQAPKENGFLYDAPTDGTYDSLGRSDFAKQLAAKLKHTHSEDSAFAMGLVGEWGSGKTSFWRLIKAQLDATPKGEDDRDSRIIFEYTPWKNHSATNIIKDFFAKLSYELQPYDSSFGRHIDTYSKLLMQVDDSSLNRFLKPFRSVFFPVQTVQEEYDRINNKLKAIGKQVIIFIDDLDRLDKSEILEVIRLIRNSANFANTVFVAAYDRNYLIKAIESFNEYNKEAFLEKIFQLEVPLPRFEEEKIKKAVLVEFEKFLDTKDFHKLNTLIPPEPDTFIEDHDKIDISYLKTLREISRLANSFRETYESLKDHIVLKDLFYVELLKTKYLGVYNLVFDGQAKFLETEGDVTISNIQWNAYKLAFFDTSKKKTLERIFKHATQKESADETPKTFFIERFLNEHAENYGVSKYQIEEAVCLLEEIFDGKKSARFELESVREPFGFYRYCYNRLSTNNISTDEFNAAKGKGIDRFKTQIDKWLTTAKDKAELAVHLFIKSQPATKEDFAFLTEARFHFAQHPTNENFSFGNYYARALLSSLGIDKVATDKKFFDTKADFWQFIEPYIEVQTYPCLLSLDLLHEAVDLPYTEEEIANKRRDLLKTHIYGTKSFLELSQFTYHYPKRIRFHSDADFLTPETKPIVLEYLQLRIKENITQFMKDSMYLDNPSILIKGYVIFRFIIEAFGGYEIYSRYLKFIKAFDTQFGAKYEAVIAKDKSTYTNRVPEDIQIVPAES